MENHSNPSTDLNNEDLTFAYEIESMNTNISKDVNAVELANFLISIFTITKPTSNDGI